MLAAGGLSATTILGIITVVIAVIGVAAAALGAVFFMSKSRGTQDSITSLQTTNEAMQVALDFERAERARDKVEAEKARAADQAECAAQIAHLRGQVESMQAHNIEALMSRVGDAMNTTVTKMLDRVEDGLQTAVKTAVAQGVEAGVKAAHGS